jgi:CubicO group peptidase (beta-lactamase class C family)
MKKRTKTYLRIILLLGTISSLFFVPWDLLGFWLSPKSDTIQEQIDAATETGLVGIIVYVDQSGKPPVTYSAGWNNRENQVPADPESLFKIASISKLYIAAATAKLVSADSMSLDDTIAELMPDLQDRIEYADEITLKMLVNHTSGLPNFTDHPDYPWDNPPGNEGALEFILDSPADFKPGAKYAYSNTNYVLLGEILDKELGFSHHRYIRERIVEPLGLSNTYSLLKEVNIDDVMSGYHTGYEPDIKQNDYPNPGGSMIATIHDVGVFLRALNDGSLLTEKEQPLYASIYGFDHTGLLPGYSSIARYHNDIDAVVIQFANTSGGNSWSLTEMTYDRILEILRAE